MKANKLEGCSFISCPNTYRGNHPSASSVWLAVYKYTKGRAIKVPTDSMEWMHSSSISLCTFRYEKTSDSSIL